MKRNNVFIIIALLVLSFFAGAAWQHQDESSDPSLAQAGSEAEERTPLRAERSKTGYTNSEQATIEIFELAAPSVVYITSISLRRDYWSRNVMEIPNGTGSGFVWSSDGFIVTNYHVIRAGERLEVTLGDQSTWEAEVVGAAPEKDLAVLKIDAPKSRLLPVAVGSSYDLRVGQFVYAIGNPFGLDQTLTTGVISALGREIESLARIPIRDAIQTDAAINPGNSGGPLLDSRGRLIGVNTQIYSPSGASAGIGFAIPADVVKWVVPDLIEYGELRRPILGVELVPQNTVRRYGLEGALVLNVSDNAAEAGIRPTARVDGRVRLGDLIIGIDNEPIRSTNDLILALEQYEAGDVVSVKVQRNKKEVTLPVRLSQSR